MWKKRKFPLFPRVSAFTAFVEKGRGSPRPLSKRVLSTEKFSFSTETCGKKPSQCREVMLLFSSFTVSAKAGAFFIFCSTWRME